MSDQSAISISTRGVHRPFEKVIRREVAVNVFAAMASASELASLSSLPSGPSSGGQSTARFGDLSESTERRMVAPIVEGASLEVANRAAAAETNLSTRSSFLRR